MPVGHAKPDPAYFRKVVATLGAEPGEVGLVAHQWRVGDDLEVLRALF